MTWLARLIERIAEAYVPSFAIHGRTPQAREAAREGATG
jgi:hypothetical protein